MKTTKTFSVRFAIRTCKKNIKQATIYARITVNGRRLEISLKRTIDPELWDPASGSVTGNKDAARQLNPYIEEVRFKLTECYRQLHLQNKVISIDSVKAMFLGEEKNASTLCSLIEYHNVNMRNTLQPGTLKNYATTARYLLLFLKQRHKADDIFLTELNYQFITEFDFFLRTCKPLEPKNPLSNNGVMKHIERLKKMVTLAAKMEWIPKDPFGRFKLKFHKTERDFLTKDELATVENYKFVDAKLERARDMFVFACYCGLSYIDLVSLTNSNISIGIDGEYWIRTSRQKTEISVNIPLLHPAKKVIDKYKHDPVVSNKGGLIPYLCNQKVNEYLKKIASICGIEKHLSFHLARHTFSTTVTLANGVPLETVSKMLGHTKLTTTQIYVHVLQKKVSDDMSQLRQKLIKSGEEDKLTVTG